MATTPYTVKKLQKFFELAHHAIKTRHIPSRKTHPRSPFLAGTGVAYNEA